VGDVTDPTPLPVLLADVMRSVGSVAKRDQNTQHNFSFRGIDAILNAVGPALREHGVIVLPTVDSIEASTVEVGRNRTRMGHVAVTVTYTFVGPGGDELTCRVPGEAMDSGDKATSKAMSVAFRTALIQALALPTDEPDPDSQTYERSDAPALMTARQQSAISERLAGLADEFAEEVKAWWKAQRYPAMSSGRLTEEQAAVVIAYLDEHTPAVTPGEAS
jgi:hypothetical protein